MFTTPKGRPTLCFIDLEALRWNFHKIREKVGPRIRIASMVKANAYGHSAPCVARALAEEGCDAFGVATLEEGVELLDAVRVPEPAEVVLAPGHASKPRSTPRPSDARVQRAEPAIHSALWARLAAW